MDKSTVHLAMREMQDLFRLSKFWISIVAVGFVLGVSGPFGTENYLSIMPRLAYWVFIVFLTYTTGCFIVALFNPILLRNITNPWIVRVLSGALVGGIVASEVLVFNGVFFGIDFSETQYWKSLIINCVIISMVVRIAIAVLFDDPKVAPQSAKEEHKAVSIPLMRRLPFDKRGSLLSISVSDHYVEVWTDKGSALLLMRLSDAINEAGEGMQIHRSHWVSYTGIKSVKRIGSKVAVNTVDGRDIPVSRTYISAVKEAGYLP